eukprot:TRINITY_DN136286_c0_g1_i1.p1 TRINITY_DN136286_c0_g1~~TRINITY_DN136286_c0_g1_i1.p1  ORF type:complete len:143 (-),score=56.75 TRINITY_DN136286_c0_g1_i1:105-533(-)
MATLTDECQEHYENIRSDNNEQNWVFLQYEGNSTIGVGGSGSGGISELAANFSDDMCGYGYVRFTTGDSESKRAKFVFVAWTGDNARVMQKAKMSVHKANVKDVFREFAVEILASDPEDLDAENVKNTVIKAGGANYMGQSS